MMALRDIAEVALTANEVAGRTGSTFKLDRNRMTSMGFSARDTKRIETAVREIEEFTEKTLAALDVAPREG